MGKNPKWAENKIRQALNTMSNVLDLDRGKGWTLSNIFDSLHQFPEEILKMDYLKKLNLHLNNIRTLPAQIKQLSKLVELDLSNNDLADLPEELSHLSSLSVLNLANNELTEIPKVVFSLSSLKQIILKGNKITEIPLEILKLTKLEKLDIEKLPLQKPPLEIASKGIQAIRNYYRQLEEKGEDHLYEAKLLIVGEPGAGKTSLAKKIQNPEYKLVNDEKSTEGIEVVSWEFKLDNDRLFRVNIWDFGGQEIYKSTHQFFLTKRSLYTLVADDRKEDTDFNYWLNIIELLSDKSPILIIKNEKQDRTKNINEREMRGRFASLQKILSVNLYTSRGLDTVIEEIERHIKNLPHVGIALPKNWVVVRNSLEKDTRNYISLEDYLMICRANGFTDMDALQLSGYLHDLGVCLHFQDDPILKHIVILKPEWGTDAAYAVLDNKKVRGGNGRFHRDNLMEIWKDPIYINAHQELLQLMLRFKLCYQIKDSEEFIAPYLLNVEQPMYNWSETNNLVVRYTYDFMPKGMLTKFIVETNDLIEDQNKTWRTGVLLSDNKNRAEIIEYYDKREIRIRVAGRSKKAMMEIVCREIENIHNSFHGIKYEKWIPCNCKTCKSLSEPFFFTQKTLEEFIANGQHKIQCQKKPYEMVDVISLIEDVIDQVELMDLGKDLAERYILQTSSQNNEIKENSVFISYAWGGESEQIAEKLEVMFKGKNISLIRDKDKLAYKGRIKEFMSQIGRGNAVISIISNKYLQSENCMFELIQIAKAGNFSNRIFPIVLDDAHIYKPVERLKYVKYWEDQFNELDNAMKTVSSANLQGFRDDIDLYDEIRRNLPELTNILKDMNTLSVKLLTESDFQDLINAVEKELKIK